MQMETNYCPNCKTEILPVKTTEPETDVESIDSSSSESSTDSSFSSTTITPDSEEAIRLIQFVFPLERHEETFFMKLQFLSRTWFHYPLIQEMSNIPTNLLEFSKLSLFMMPKMILHYITGWIKPFIQEFMYIPTDLLEISKLTPKTMVCYGTGILTLLQAQKRRGFFF
jgi:hypothetical protein